MNRTTTCGKRETHYFLFKYVSILVRSTNAPSTVLSQLFQIIPLLKPTLVLPLMSLPLYDISSLLKPLGPEVVPELPKLLKVR